MRQLRGPGAVEGGTDEVLIFAGGADDEGLSFVLESGLDVEFLSGTFDGGPADAGAVDLIEVKVLRKIVIEAGLCEDVEARREVAVTFGIGMIDRAF